MVFLVSGEESFKCALMFKKTIFDQNTRKTINSKRSNKIRVQSFNAIGEYKFLISETVDWHSEHAEIKLIYELARH